MANYVITTHKIGPEDADTVLAALETYLETLDSTNQAVIDISYLPMGSQVLCLVVHNDTS